MPLTRGSSSVVACEVCGASYQIPTSLVGRVFTCSKECSQMLARTRIIRAQGPLPDLPDRTARSYKSAVREVRSCIICGSPYLAAPQSIIKTCSDECDSERRRRNRRTPRMIMCAHCGAETPNHTGKKYCSNECRLAALNALPRPIKPMDERKRTLTPKGYIMLRAPDGRSMFEHRYVMEQLIGRQLTADERVHHKNHDRTDNRPENLELFSSHSEHMAHHRLEREMAARPESPSPDGRNDLVSTPAR